MEKKKKKKKKGRFPLADVVNVSHLLSVQE